MEKIITGKILRGDVKCIPSKSMAHRMYIAAALAAVRNTELIRDGGWLNKVACDFESEDIRATKNALGALLAAYAQKQGSNDYDNERISDIDCGESGSTLRFIVPVAAALGIRARFVMHGRLGARPMGPLCEALESHGCRFDTGASEDGKTAYLYLFGRLEGGEFTIPGDISSQFITGLLFAIPLLGEKGRINVTGRLESFPYIAMTLSVLKMAGICAEYAGDESCFVIQKSSGYNTCDFSVEGDWSNAAFWLCASALNPANKIKCLGLDTASEQGDRRILDVLQRFGAKVEYEEGITVISSGELCPTEIDAADIPDLIPVISVVAAAANGTTRIKNAARLRYKESDRLEAISHMLTALGGEVKELPDGLLIVGKGRLAGGTVDSFGDHRIAMSAAVAAQICDGPVTITNAAAVNKSYPGFYEVLEALA